MPSKLPPSKRQFQAVTLSDAAVKLLDNYRNRADLPSRSAAVLHLLAAVEQLEGAVAAAEAASMTPQAAKAALRKALGLDGEYLQKAVKALFPDA